jgi:hypothetical protein
VQWLSIRIALTGVGTYVLNESQVSLLEIVGGDVVSSARRGSALAPGVLTLSEIGATGDLVVGTARFTLSPADGRPAYPEPVDFTDGEFTVRLSAPYGMPPAIR